ncbi:hypothetical protein LTR62_002643 [Meristemomyces frigidus]|uniref:Uncharacterized protein n=1 Tax=Meristemomyces frigidus TaxID=1508187 RepID=A0AAN7T784_9PEZI|nr:hypothetical protein LTR62_002643 [Meristemomyces frigidus]
MTSRYSTIKAIMLFTAAEALASSIAATTQLPRVPGLQEWTPKPTPAPELPHVALARRDFSSICGYVDGVSTNSLDCGPGVCGFNTYSSAFGCCSSTYISANSAYAADSNTAVMACTDSSYPYCAPLTYSGGLSNYFCAVTTMGTTPQPVLASWVYGVNFSTSSIPVASTTSTPGPSSTGSNSASYAAASYTGSSNNIAVSSPSPTAFSQSQQFGYATASGSTASASTSSTKSGSSAIAPGGVLRAPLLAVICVLGLLL